MGIPVKKLKDLGWEKFVGTSEVFEGAVAVFDTEEGSENEQVAVLFVGNMAYIVKDDQGLYFADDYVDGVIKDPNVPHKSGNFDDVTVLASYSLEDDSEGAIGLAEEELTALGLNYHEVRESILLRLETFREVEMKLSGQSAI